MSQNKLTYQDFEIEQLKENYSFRNQSEVLEFIDNNSSLLPLLQESTEKIRRFFPNTPLILTVATNTETASREKMLLILIASDMESENLLGKLLELDSEWGGKVEYESHGKMLINLGY
ncbi:MAG: hypothetical protein ACOC0N_05045 [Chroococcales cyanobacterium]